jgi:toxin ParE1/3/4
MAEFVLARRARAELIEIFEYGLDQFGERQARGYAAELEHVFQLLADTPEMGRPAEIIRPGVRRHEHQSHVILYEIIQSGVRILAVVHNRSVRRLTL